MRIDARMGRTAPPRAGMLPGKVLGGFKYEGTRPDDPNDVIPHEHRRELRALRVFGAWTNLTDMKAGNTLDTVVTEGGRGLVRHYLQDVGSTFGVGANGPHEWNEGWEHIYEGGPSRKRLFTFGFDCSAWQTAPYESTPPWAASKAMPSIPRPGSRVRRPQPTWRCETTTRSGRRGG